MFFFHELRPTLNVQSDLIRGFVISFLLVFSLHVFIDRLHRKKFLYFLCAYIFFYSSILHSLDNDRSTVEASCFTVDFIVSCFKKRLLIGNEFDY